MRIVDDIDVDSTGASTRLLPLAVDLDGTLLKTDLLWESLLAVARRNIFALLWVPIWLLRGKAHLKQELAKRANIDLSVLPMNRDLIEFLRTEHARGRKLILVTGADHLLARGVAKHVPLFSEVFASNGTINLTRDIKANLLVQEFGEKGFDYAGNDGADLPVWLHANAALLVNSPRRIVNKAQKIISVQRSFHDRRRFAYAILSALRVRHWTKNALVFVPLLTSHRWTDLQLWMNCGLAFLAFSVVASVVYVLNDLCDLQNDRAHPSKKYRVFASGELSITTGIGLIACLLAIEVGVGLLLPSFFLAILGTYFVFNVAYSFHLKKVLMLDVLLLALFYAVRINAGGTAAGIAISHWLMIFSVFIFLSLASGKRAAELHELRKQNRENVVGRGYSTPDLEQLASQGIASGYIAILIFALYIYSPEVTVLYRSPQLLWLVTPILLYWIGRFWMLVHRGEVKEDPLIFVIKDKVSFLVGILIIIVMMAAK